MEETQTNNKTKGLGFRVSNKEADIILKASAIKGVKYSTFCRNSALIMAQDIILNEKKRISKSLSDKFEETFKND